MEFSSDTSSSKRRALYYWATGGGLMVLFLALQAYNPVSDWRGSDDLHTIMEVVATMLAFMVGSLALVRYYSRKEAAILFVGVGFLGTGVLDGYHAAVTSVYFQQYMPSDTSSLIPWSWVASRMYLSVLMVFSAMASQIPGTSTTINEWKFYLGSATFTLLCFLFFAFVPLPAAYYPDIFFHRPEEFAPALFFLLALIFYLKQGTWRAHLYEHWLVMSLVVGVVCQAVFMSHSGTLFDIEFDVAHLLKKISYICVLTGLVASMYVVFKREEASIAELTSSVQKLAESEGRVRAIVENIVDGIITINAQGTIQSVNKAAEKLFRYSSEQMLGQNIKILAAAPYGDKHDQYLRDYKSTGKSSIIGVGREVEGLRQDGTTFPMQLEIGEIILGHERLFLGVVRDISEQKEVERMKSEFVSTVSHELRTPLTSIRGSLGMIESGVLKDPADVARMLELASKNTERLIQLVNDLLTLRNFRRTSLKSS